MLHKMAPNIRLFLENVLFDTTVKFPTKISELYWITFIYSEILKWRPTVRTQRFFVNYLVSTLKVEIALVKATWYLYICRCSNFYRQNKIIADNTSGRSVNAPSMVLDSTGLPDESCSSYRPYIGLSVNDPN